VYRDRLGRQTSLLGDSPRHTWRGSHIGNLGERYRTWPGRVPETVRVFGHSLRFASEDRLASSGQKLAPSH